MPSPEEYSAALDRIEGLSPAPQILARVAQKLRDPHIDVSDIVELIRTDGSLTSDIIRLSNSAYYGAPEPSKTVGTALARVGFNEALRLINLSISRNVLHNDLDAYGITAFDYWCEGVSCAVFLDELATVSREATEDAYTTGVLHAIGRVVINQLLNNFGMSVFWDGLSSLEDWEHAEVGFDFTYAGSELLKRWDFPDSITEAIANHLDTEQAAKTSPLALMLNLARIILPLSGRDFSKTEIDLPEEGHPFLSEHNIDAEAMSDLLSRCHGEFQRTLAVLRA